ncbi:tRNA1(Val) (adenine(37)-N6)-methyltransferase [Vibrio stylophorae]|uniref:tRNA1(Val) (adenine(37)-N6)-methyltransferase n=1 Tax=Vibrio stylophorae TaxID=659351 RepID=A0ABN8DNF1_9VIBR|nr:tRNA1(Val) (adenine(37)-N6)-methyltransferase [Vibrio stylophorae]
MSTDAVILGAWSWLPFQGNILDLGCGTGVLSLMCAQRQENIRIHALDIAKSAIETCQDNVLQSPWAHRIDVIHQSVQDWQQQHIAQYDAIICNPPYFGHGLQAQKTDRATARHDDQLSQTALLSSLRQLLKPTAVASLILPTYEAQQLIAQASEHQLYCIAQLAIHTTAKKPCQRIAFCLSPTPAVMHTASLTIHDGAGYDANFIALTRDFYLKFDSEGDTERSSTGHS